MIGLDTNVIVRYLTEDGEGDQVERAVAAFESLSPQQPGYVTLIVAAELWWVLGRSYKMSRDNRCESLSDLMDSAEIKFQDHELVRQAIELTRDGADFADALIALLAKRDGCVETGTLDVKSSNTTVMKLI